MCDCAVEKLKVPVCWLPIQVHYWICANYFSATFYLNVKIGVFLNFPEVYEDGNITQVIVTYEDSQIGVIVNGTQDQLLVQILMPDEFKVSVLSFLFNFSSDFLSPL